MGIVSRIISVIVGIIILVAGVLLLFLSLNVMDPNIFPYTRFDLLLLVGDYNYTVLGFVLVILGVLLIASFSRRKRKKEGKNIVSHTDEKWELRISFEAIDSMVLTASKQVKGIRDVNTRISSTEQGLTINIRIQTIPGLPIQEIMSELQEKVREYVEEMSGITVAEVKILVEGVAREKIQKSAH